MNKNNTDNKKMEKLFLAHGVAFAYLFGSQALGKAHTFSDRDICDEKQRIDFEVSAMSHYFDRQYYIRRGADRAIHLVAQQGLR